MEVKDILGFRGKYGFLSNMYMIDIEIDGIVYKSSEHYYMAMKTTNDVYRQKIMDAPNSPKAKRIAAKIPLRTDWEEKYKNQTMLVALVNKFRIPEMRDKLLATGNSYIEETNHWNDVYWGVCNGEGKNMLGKMLMFVRKYHCVKSI